MLAIRKNQSRYQNKLLRSLLFFLLQFVLILSNDLSKLSYFEYSYLFEEILSPSRFN